MIENKKWTAVSISRVGYGGSWTGSKLAIQVTAESTPEWIPVADDITEIVMSILSLASNVTLDQTSPNVSIFVEDMRLRGITVKLNPEANGSGTDPGVSV